MINSEKIKARAKELGIRQKDIAKALGIRQATTSQKLNNIRSMSIGEAVILARMLQIGDGEFASYFAVQTQDLAGRR